MLFIHNGNRIMSTSSCREVASDDLYTIRKRPYEYIDILGIRKREVEVRRQDLYDAILKLFSLTSSAFDKVRGTTELPPMEVVGGDIKNFRLKFAYYRPVSSFFMYFPRLIAICDPDKVTEKFLNNVTDYYNLDAIMKDSPICDELLEVYQILVLPLRCLAYGRNSFWTFANHLMTTDNVTVLNDVYKRNGFYNAVNCNLELLSFRNRLPYLVLRHTLEGQE